MGSQRRSTPVKVAHALDESTRRALMAMAGTPEPKSADSKVPPRSAPKRSPRQHSSPAVSVETLAAQAGPAAASKSAAAAQRMVAAARRRRATAPQAATNAAAAVAPTIAAPVAAENPRSARPPQEEFHQERLCFRHTVVDDPVSTPHSRCVLQKRDTPSYSRSDGEQAGTPGDPQAPPPASRVGQETPHCAAVRPFPLPAGREGDERAGARGTPL